MYISLDDTYYFLNSCIMTSKNFVVILYYNSLDFGDYLFRTQSVLIYNKETKENYIVKYQWYSKDKGFFSKGPCSIDTLGISIHNHNNSLYILKLTEKFNIKNIEQYELLNKLLIYKKSSLKNINNLTKNQTRIETEIIEPIEIETEIIEPIEIETEIIEPGEIETEIIERQRAIIATKEREKKIRRSTIQSTIVQHYEVLPPINNSSLKSYDYIDDEQQLTRFIKYNKIISYLNENIRDELNCITPYQDKDNNKYLLSEKILLYKQIGSLSVYGVIYKCKIIVPVDNDIPIFSAKLQLNTVANVNENKILKILSNYAIDNKIHNLPLVYKIVNCNNIIRTNLYPKIIKNSDSSFTGYSLILNELAKGDIHGFLIQFKDRTEIIKNAYEQIIMCLAVLHRIGILHNDAHIGNFLYHKIKRGGCFHYNFNGINYYIENLGYLWTSWDYGLSKKLNRPQDYLIDYKKMCHSFNCCYINRTSGNFSNSIQNSITRDKPLTEDKWLERILTKGRLFSKVPIGKILSSINLNNIQPYTF